MVEDNVVTLDSLEYPSYFIVFSPKATVGGYPLILGRPWLAMANACIACCSRKMIISNGINTKKLTLHFLAKPHSELDEVVWLYLGDAPLEVSSMQKLMVIESNRFMVS